MNLKTSIDNFVLDPEYPKHNFDLAQSYENENQYGAAVSYYLRTAELTSNKLLAYESLLRLYICFNRIGGRDYFSENILLRTVALMPKRPEGYLMLSQHYERTKKWFSAYTYAVIGENMIFEEESRLETDVNYPGFFVFKFQRAVTSWWVGRFMESLALFKELLNVTMPDSFAIPVRNNVKNLTEILTGGGQFSSGYVIPHEYPYYMYKYFSKYSFTQYHTLRLKFPGAEKIKENFSQALQDMFVLGITKGKREGTFLEIGCSVPVYNNNTYLLEKKFDWKGIAVDINKDAVRLYLAKRAAYVINNDATKINYADVLNDVFPGKTDIDYLQIDCEPAHASYKVLLSIPFHKYRFAVVTFEHDNYIDEDHSVRDKSRMFLKSQGYMMLVTDVTFDKYGEFEDWWVHPDLVSKEIIETVREANRRKTRVDDIIFM